ncbi:IclR family transcriptional regulator [Microbacterium sp. NPDC091313]
MLDSGPADEADANGARGDLQVVARVAAILRLLTPTESSIGLTEAAEGLGLGKSTTHRYLTSLENHGFLRRVDGPRFTTGPLIDQLGALAMTRWRLTEAAAPVMQQLASTTHQTAVLSAWGGMGPVITRTTEDDTQIVHISVRPGSTLPLLSAQGLVFLAFLGDQRITDTVLATVNARVSSELRARVADVRARGIAVYEQVVSGVRAVAVPVFDRDDAITGVLALVGTLNSIPADPASGIAQALAESGRHLTALLRGAATQD